MSSALDSFQAGVKQLESALDDPNIPWKQLVIYLLWATYAWETYVSLRQYRLYSRPAPPATLAAHVDLETYNKSQAYGRDKMRFGFVSGLFSQIMTYAIVKYDLYAVVWAKAGEVLQPWGYAGREVSRYMHCEGRLLEKRSLQWASKVRVQRLQHYTDSAAIGR